jgi:hypothetical protein
VGEELRVPDYVGRMAGVRSWKIAPTLWAQMGGWLWSAANLGPWPDGEENVAVCEVDHPVPAKGCSCGLYAFYTPAGRLPYAATARTTVGSISGVIGTAGRIIPGDLAYRAERAKVLALFEDPLDTPKEEISAAHGGIPIIRVADFEDFCDWYGLIRYDPKQQRGR